MVMAFNQGLEEEPIRRPRSPSPFIASTHSTQQSNGISETPRVQEHPRGRRKPAAYTSGQKRRTPDPTQVTSYRDSELPPIVVGTSGSATSARRSSRDSRESGPRPAPILRLSDASSKPPLLSLDAPPSPRNPPGAIKRSSPASASQEATGSSNKSNRSVGGHSSGITGLHRNKTMLYDSNTEGGKLETLLERNGGLNRRENTVIGGGGVGGGVGQMRRNTHSFSSIISLQNNNLTANKRTKSHTNLSKLSENTGGPQPFSEKRPLMSRYRSDTNLNLHTNNSGNPTNPRRVATSIINNNKPVASRKTRAPLKAAPAPKPSEQTLNSQNLSQQEEEEEDCEMRRRIHEWLEGVDEAEHPPIQDIEDEGPPQTDTAIHIVWDGD